MEKVLDNKKYEVYILSIHFKNSGHYTNSYILKDKSTEECMLIDPAYDGEYILECINKIGGNLKIIYLTHCHGDHIAALEHLYTKYEKQDINICIHYKDKHGIFDDDKNCRYILSEPKFTLICDNNISGVKEEELLKVGCTTLTVISTPGHTDGSSMLYEKDYNILFTGDTLFSDCHGRTDLKSGSMSDMRESLDKIFNSFDDTTIIYPGHGQYCKLGDTKNILYGYY